MLNNMISIVLRDIKINNKSFKDLLFILSIYIGLVLIFPLSLGPSSKLLSTLAPSIVWICALITSISVIDKFFTLDMNDGWLELLLISNIPLEMIVLMKALSHWLSVGLPLIIISPVVCIFLNMPISSIPITICSLILGTCSLTLIGMMGAALVLGAKKTNTIVILLVLPLTVPVLIFGVATINAHINGNSYTPHILLSAMCLSFLIALSPIATSTAIRIAIE